MTAVTQRADVAAALRGAILNGQLLPNERLVEVDLAARFATTRAQIRSAIGLLEGEGLVVSEPYKGARVRLVTAAEAIEVSEARAALETVVAQKAAERALPPEIDQLDAILARMRAAVSVGDLIEYSKLNGELHAAICRISRHVIAGKLLVTLNSSMIRFRFRAIMIPGRASNSLTEHEAIVSAIKAHDPDRAHASMATHLRHVVDALRRAIAAEDEPMHLASPLRGTGGQPGETSGRRTPAHPAS